MRLGVLTVLFLACSPAHTQPKGSMSDDWPPARYQSDADVEVHFRSPAEIQRLCSPVRVCGYRTLACTVSDEHGRTVINLPNPNTTNDRGEAYRRLVAHELGHAVGWAADHPK